MSSDPIELTIRETTETDLGFVIDAGSDADARRFVPQWPRPRHRDAIARADEEHLLIVERDRPVGFALLAGIGDENRSIEIRRIVVARRGEGLGRRALAPILERAFTHQDAHRVWLDVITWNERAQRAYAAAGFVCEGVLREVLYLNGRFESLVVMSVLRAEWETLRTR